MWASEKQQCAVIRTLLASVHLERLWTATGPTKEAITLLEAKGGYLSSGERLVLLVAFDVWNGHGNAEVGDLLATLDERRLRAVTDALLARDAGEEA